MLGVDGSCFSLVSVLSSHPWWPALTLLALMCLTCVHLYPHTHSVPLWQKKTSAYIKGKQNMSNKSHYRIRSHIRAVMCDQMSPRRQQDA